MRRTARLLTVAALSAASLSGCGTVCNFASLDPKPYGGVAKDWELFDSVPRRLREDGFRLGGAGGIPIFFALVGLGMTEWACSVVGDTLTYPAFCLWRGEPLIPEPRRPRPAPEPAEEARPVSEAELASCPVQYAAGAVAEASGPPSPAPYTAGAAGDVPSPPWLVPVGAPKASGGASGQAP